jgi:hypothetical protein
MENEMRTDRLRTRTGWTMWLGSTVLLAGCSSAKTPPDGGAGGMDAGDAGAMDASDAGDDADAMPEAGPACGPLVTVPFAPAMAGTFDGKPGAACTRDIDCDEGTFCVVVYGTCAQPSMLMGPGKGGHLPDGGACVPAPAFPTTCDPGALEWSDPADVSKHPGSLAESDAALLAGAEGSVLVSWANNATTGDQTNGLAVSTNGGASFAPIAAPVQAASSDQNDDVLAMDTGGTLYYVWQGFGAKLAGAQHIWSATSQGGSTWSKALQVDTPADDESGAIPLDFPSLAVNPVNRRPYFTYQVTTATGPVPIKLVVGAPGGASVSPSVELDDGTRPASYRDLANGAFDAAGSFFAAWVELAGSGGSTGQGLESGDVQNAVYATRVDLGASGGLMPLGHDVVASSKGEAVVFGLPEIHVTSDGTAVFVVYETGTDNAIDVRVATSHDRGLTFGSSVKINDDASCATHDHAASALDAKGRLWVLWYDNRDGSGHLVYSVSTDGGETFAPNRLVTPYAFPFETFQYSVGWLGDYFGVATTADTLFAAWSDPHDDDQSHINFARAALPP